MEKMLHNSVVHDKVCGYDKVCPLLAVKKTFEL